MPPILRIERRVPPILRIENEAGEVWEDPSKDFLLMMLEELGSGNTFLVAQRLDAAGAEYSMQVARGPRGYVVEHREHCEGAAGRHFRARVRPRRVVHGVLTRWCFDHVGWRTQVRWETLQLPEYDHSETER